MKWLSLLVAALLAAVGISLLLKDETGYVMLSWGEWTVETSLALFILLLLVLFAVAYLAVRALIRLWQIPRTTSRWSTERRKKKNLGNIVRGHVELAEGKWQAAEKHLLKHVQHSDTPLLNYLGAAQAAQQQGAIERRDHYLQLAYKEDKKAALAVQLTQAELQLAEGNPEQAQKTLAYLKEVAPKHPRVLSLLAQAYKELGQWNKLRGLLPTLRRRHIFTEEDLKELEQQTFLGILERAIQSDDEKQLRETWNGLPKEARSNPVLVARYATALAQHKEGDEAEAILRSTLRKQWAPELVRLYGEIKGANTERQLSIAESWLQAHPKDPDLLLTLGKLALREQEWNKAKGYLESALSAAPNAEACQLLAGLLEQQGDRERAVEYYREGMRLALGGESIEGGALSAPETRPKLNSGTPAAEPQETTEAAPLPPAATEKK